MLDIESTINTLVPQAYEAHIVKYGLHPGTDMSQSDQCQPLTYDMMQGLQNREIPVRREEHEDDEKIWHFLLAHAAVDAEPTDNDLVTDMNPWQWDKEKQFSGFLHGQRYEVMKKLGDAGAPDYFIALRGIHTIKTLHRQNW